ncbi:MAG: hypothetical protein WED00_12275 [Aquisalimonadaceae bacterium]
MSCHRVIGHRCCDALWNLLPAHRRVNQHEKRARLPSTARLEDARERLQQWWDAGYLLEDQSVLRRQFLTEAEATLPLSADWPANVDGIFDGLVTQQIRLRFDQQIPEW